MFKTPSKNMLTAAILQFVDALTVRGYARALWLKDVRNKLDMEGMKGRFLRGGGFIGYFREREKRKC
jgi:hypothetical protein